MRTAEQNQQNQHKCDKCGKIVGCDYRGRKHKCNYKAYACESCSRVRTDVIWRDDTEQYECQECYQWFLDHN